MFFPCIFRWLMGAIGFALGQVKLTWKIFIISVLLQNRGLGFITVNQTKWLIMVRKRFNHKGAERKACSISAAHWSSLPESAVKSGSKQAAERVYSKLANSHRSGWFQGKSCSDNNPGVTYCRRSKEWGEERKREKERENKASVRRADQCSSLRLSGPDVLCLLWTV